MISYIHYIIVEKQNTKPYSYQNVKKESHRCQKIFSKLYYIYNYYIITLYYDILASCEIKYDEAKTQMFQ